MFANCSRIRSRFAVVFASLSMVAVLMVAPSTVQAQRATGDGSGQQSRSGDNTIFVRRAGTTRFIEGLRRQNRLNSQTGLPSVTAARNYISSVTNGRPPTRAKVASVFTELLLASRTTAGCQRLVLSTFQAVQAIDAVISEISTRAILDRYVRRNAQDKRRAEENPAFIQRLNSQLVLANANSGCVTTMEVNGALARLFVLNSNR